MGGIALVALQRLPQGAHRRAQGRVAGVDGLIQFGHVAAWVALAAWIATAAGWARHRLPPVRRLVRSEPGAKPQAPSAAAPDPTPRSGT